MEINILRDTGRGIKPLGKFSRGQLATAAKWLNRSRGVAVVTGFPVPTPAGPLPETDGPVGAASVAAYLGCIGTSFSVLTDPLNVAVCESVLSVYGIPTSRVRTVTNEELLNVGAELREAGLDTLLYIESPGPNTEGRYMSMNGVDLTPTIVRFDRLINSGLHTIAIGDGGNEVGMGGVPHSAVVASISHGDQIHCAVPADELVLAAVSNWGAWALIAAAAVDDVSRSSCAAEALSVMRWSAALEAAVEAGAVDGVSHEPVPLVDGLDQSIHTSILQSLRAAASLE